MVATKTATTAKKTRTSTRTTKAAALKAEETAANQEDLITKETAESKSTDTAQLGAVIMLYTKSSSHWYAMTNPEIVTIAGTKFVRGKQVTGKEGHRMEGKITLVPLEHVASIIEFELEEDLWNESQPKNLPFPVDEACQSAVLTSHEQLQQPVRTPKKRNLTKPPKNFNSHFNPKFKSRQPRFSDHGDF